MPSLPSISAASGASFKRSEGVENQWELKTAKYNQDYRAKEKQAKRRHTELQGPAKQ